MCTLAGSRPSRVRRRLVRTCHETPSPWPPKMIVDCEICRIAAPIFAVSAGQTVGPTRVVVAHREKAMSTQTKPSATRSWRELTRTSTRATNLPVCRSQVACAGKELVVLLTAASRTHAHTVGVQLEPQRPSTLCYCLQLWVSSPNHCIWNPLSGSRGENVCVIGTTPPRFNTWIFP